MNLPTHMSGQFSGQVPNQSGTSLSAVPHQQNMMQSSGGQRTLNMDPSLENARRFIQDKIYELLMRRQKTQEEDPKKVIDIVRRLEECLFKTATTKEEYMNIETLENRLHVLIKRLSLNNNHNQQYQQQGNTSVPMGTMIPNPGMPQSGNSSIMNPSSMDNMVLPAVNTGNYLPNSSQIPTMHNGSLGSSDGLTNSYQQSTTNFSNNAGGNSLISSMGAQRMSSQMIPTPGFSNSNITNNQSYMNMDSSNSVVGLSTIDSTTVSQPLQQLTTLFGLMLSR